MGNCWPKPVENLPSSIFKQPTATPAEEQIGDQHNKYLIKKSTSDDSFQTQTITAHPPPLLPLKPVEFHHQDDRTLPSAAASGGQIITPNLKMFTFAELKSATRNFRPDTVLGEGGFGRVFKGWVDEKTYAPSRVGAGIAVAVKKSNPDSEQGLKEWQAEVKFLGKFSHPNLVKLIGYCWEDREFLLVYEYMQKGSLESHLFRNGAEALPWDIRLKIAIGAARGLAFLHTTEKQVIYRDFKASNILLDGEFNAKLSDFGLAKLGPDNGDSHVTTRVVGTYGYAAPEYMATGHLYVKSDVYGFGVVLLEIITGLRVLDLNRPSGEHNLVDWARPVLPDKRKLRKIIDPKLAGQYPLRGAYHLAALILKCLEPDPKNRPSTEEILENLEQICTIKVKSKDTKCSQDEPSANHRYRNYHDSPLHTKYHSASATGPSRARRQLPAVKSY